MTLYLLGTGAAVSDPHRTTTMFALEEEGVHVLVDCGGDAVQRMLAVGFDPVTLDAVLLTHEHPDHISGFPLLIEKLWLLGRREPIHVYGPAATLHAVRALWGVFDTTRWEGLPDLYWHEVDFEPGASVLAQDGLTVTATPVDHPVPTIGLRFEGRSGTTLAYSCDTAFSQAVVELARGADVLIHEATGAHPGVHASAEEAAQVAAQAGVDRLILVHLPPGQTEDDLVEARHRFSQTEFGLEQGVYEFSVAASPPSGP